MLNNNSQAAGITLYCIFRHILQKIVNIYVLREELVRTFMIFKKYSDLSWQLY